MADITIIVIESGAAGRKSLRDAMPKQIRAALEQAGKDVNMESGEELREGLPSGFPKSFVVPEEVLTFPDEEGEPETTKKRRRNMRALNNKIKRKRTAGNTES